MFKLNRMIDYAIGVLCVLAHRYGEILATAQLAAVTGLNQPTVAKAAKSLLQLAYWKPTGACTADIGWSVMQQQSRWFSLSEQWKARSRGMIVLRVPKTLAW